jgi:hypothetical protein
VAVFPAGPVRSCLYQHPSVLHNVRELDQSIPLCTASPPRPVLTRLENAPMTQCMSLCAESLLGWGWQTHTVQVKVTPDGKGCADAGDGDYECHGVQLRVSMDETAV